MLGLTLHKSELIKALVPRQLTVAKANKEASNATVGVGIEYHSAFYSLYCVDY